MTEFERVKAEIKEKFDFLNSIYDENFEPKFREVEVWKFPVSLNKHGELILVPGFFERCSEVGKAACIGLCYGWLYMYKYHCELIDGIYSIKVAPDKIMYSVWEKLGVSFPKDEGLSFYGKLETLLRPVRRSYFSQTKDKCVFDVGYEFRDGLSCRSVTEIFEDGDNSMVAHKCVYPERDKELSRRVVIKEEDLVRMTL